MSELRTRITQVQKDAMRAKDQQKLSAVRLVMASLKDKDIAARTQNKPDGISDQEILSMLQSMIKQRHESIRMYKEGGREELAAREAAEIDVIESFLPAQLSEEETVKAVEAAIAQSGAASIKDMGKVMGVLKAKYAGEIDMGKVSALVKEKLG